jgi:penicillin amidase
LTYRILALIPLLILMVSCTSLFYRPVKKDLEARYRDFPTRGVPLLAKAEIRWNEYQVPYIKAETDRDCAFLLGMAHAHLRLGQMSLLREAANCRLAEHLGPLATGIDHTLRAMQLFTAVDGIQASLPPETLSWLGAYAEGVNYYQTELKDLPLEMRMLKIKPEPWTVKDIIRLGRLIAADVNWINYFSLLRLADEPRWPGYWELLKASGSGAVSSSDPLAFGPASLLRDYSRSGSNAYALAPDRTKSGGAVMASDPHLGLQLPNFWLIAGYECPSYHVLGLMFPGIPIVMVGRNDRIAWSGTNMRSASSDLFELKPGDLDSLTLTREKIRVRWWFDKTVELRRHPLGPVVSDAPYLRSGDKTFILRWVGHQPSDEMSALLKVNQAGDWSSFRAAFATYAVSGQNFVYADKDGHIGLVPAVRIPVRSYPRPPSLILSDSPETQWRGFLNATQLPFVYDPASGFVASANNKPVETEVPLGFFYSADDRVRRLREVLGGDQKADLSLLRGLQTDTCVPSARATARLMAAKLTARAAAALTPEEGRVIAALGDWDGSYGAGSKEPVYYQMLLYLFARSLYTEKYGKKLAGRLLGSDLINELVAAELGMIDATGLQRLELALSITARKHKRYANWGEMHRLAYKHLLGNIPLIGGRFRYGEVPVGGTSNSLMKTAHQLSDGRTYAAYGADARFISFLNDDDENYFALLGAQDGWLGGDGITNQLGLWERGEYMRIPFQWDKVQSAFSRRMTFVP